MREKMNVLFIMTDQQRADHLSCMGNPVLKTPNLDQIAKDGVRFTRAYCSNPMCMPNRATIFTGKYPSVHGVRCNGINLNPKIPTITQKLSENGYHTISIGKLHFQFSVPPYSRKDRSEECVLNWISGKGSSGFPIPYYGFDEVEITVGHGDGIVGHYLEWLQEKAPEYIEYVKKRALNAFKSVYHDTTLPHELYQTSFITERTISFLERYSRGDYKN
ncbi:MAG: sulfatase, partial [Promethearchaeota archaeon]